MRMLCWMCPRTRNDRIRNENIRESWGSKYRRKDDTNSDQVVWACNEKICRL